MKTSYFRPLRAPNASGGYGVARARNKGDMLGTWGALGLSTFKPNGTNINSWAQGTKHGQSRVPAGFFQSLSCLLPTWDHVHPGAQPEIVWKGVASNEALHNKDFPCCFIRAMYTSFLLTKWNWLNLMKWIQMIELLELKLTDGPKCNFPAKESDQGRDCSRSIRSNKLLQEAPLSQMDVLVAHSWTWNRFVKKQ